MSLLPFTAEVGQNYHTTFDNSFANIFPLRYNLIGAFATPLPCANPLCRQETCVCECSSPPTSSGVESMGKKKTSNPTDDILNSVKSAPKQVPSKKATVVTGEYNIYTEGNTIAQDEQVLVEEQGNTPYARRLHNMRRLPKFAEPSPGLFMGSDVNRSLLPDENKIYVDTEYNIYGRPESSLVKKRIAQLNGFNEGLNAYNYLPPDIPGSFGKPFIEYNFYISYGLGNQQVWSDRIYQFQNRPDNYTGPIGQNGLPIDKETQGLCLYVNGMANRIIYLVRGCQPYTFHFPLQKDNCLLPCDVDVCDLDRNGGFYITEDPIGGNPSNFLNNIGALFTPSGQGFQPKPLRDTNFLRPGGFCSFLVDNTWPDVLFYQSLSGPFMGGRIIVLGNWSRP